jgi:hypothetical protein
MIAFFPASRLGLAPGLRGNRRSDTRAVQAPRRKPGAQDWGFRWFGVSSPPMLRRMGGSSLWALGLWCALAPDAAHAQQGAPRPSAKAPVAVGYEQR